MSRRSALLALGLTTVGSMLVGCGERIGEFVPASAISRHGFATHAGLHEQEIAVWGFVDAGNLYADPSTRPILGDWWSGEGPTPSTWRFDLKARAGDAVGRSFAVHVPNDPGGAALLRAFVANARAQRPTSVFVRGRLSVFDAPGTVGRRTGLTLHARSSADISLTAR